MADKKIFVTYDIDETGSGARRLIYRVAEELPFRGAVISWEVGEFKIGGAEEVYGVRLRYRSAEGNSVREELVNTSRYAQNVGVFCGELPEEYRGNIQRVA